MSYLIQFSHPDGGDAIAIEPPLNWEEVRYARAAVDDLADGGLLTIEVREEAEETLAGTLHRKEGYAIAAATENPIKAYHVIAELQTILNEIHSRGRAHTYVGFIRAQGDQWGDLRRLTVDNNDTPMAVWEVAAIEWPGGSREATRHRPGTYPQDL